MVSDTFVTQKTFAALCGVSKAAVTKWKSRGLLVYQEGTRLVNAGASLEKLGRRPEKYRGGTKKTQVLEKKKQEVDAEDDLKKFSDSDSDDITHAEATRVKEVYLAKQQKLKYEIEIGKFVPIDDAVQQVAIEYGVVRSRLLGISARVAARLAVINNPEEIRHFLDDEINTVLEGLTLERELSNREAQPHQSINADQM